MQLGLTLKIKVAMAGETNAGKSSLIQRQIQDTFAQVMTCTIGVDFKTKDYQVEVDIARVQLWDIVGAQRFWPYRKHYFNNMQAICLCFDLNDNYSFQMLTKWAKAIESYAFSFKYSMYLVGCKCDLQQIVPSQEIIKFAQEYKMEYIKTSAKENIGVNEGIRKIVNNVIGDVLKDPEMVAKLKIQPKQQPSSYCHV